MPGLFYLFPFLDLKRYQYLIILTVFTKVLAVIFLLSHARVTLTPGVIRLAAHVDGLMALLLVYFYATCKVKRIL